MLFVDRHIATDQPYPSNNAATSHSYHDRSSREGSSEMGEISVRGSTKKQAIELREPISERELTTREKIILLEASKLHGSRFPPWTSPPISSDFDLLSGEPYFT